MNADDQERLARLVRAGFGSVGEADPPHDLWPKVLARIHERPRLSLFDRALLAALLAFGLLAPRSLLLLMYSV